MLASTDRHFSYLVLIALLFCSFSLVQAQVHGVPASVTSFGFGGSTSPTPGVAASVTSLGPNGFLNTRPIFGGHCCFNPAFNGNFHTPVFHSRGLRHHRAFFGGIPVFSVPYTPVIVVAPGMTSDYADYDEVEDTAGPTIFERHGSRWQNFRSREAEPERTQVPAPVVSASSQPAEPQAVAAQPSTVLVFKDGRQAEVLNYAIVSDTLFDLSDGRTHKIQLADIDLPATRKMNDDRGVDFKVPAAP